jgi:hypothetical protein
MTDLTLSSPGKSQRLRLNTLIRLRWLAIVGQSATVLLVAYWLGFPLRVGACFALIACSAWLNLFLAFRYPAAQRWDHMRRSASCCSTACNSQACFTSPAASPIRSRC